MKKPDLPFTVNTKILTKFYSSLAKKTQAEFRNTQMKIQQNMPLQLPLYAK
jgi:hypothetical protein